MGNSLSLLRSPCQDYPLRVLVVVAQGKGFFQEEGLRKIEIMASGEDVHTIEGMLSGRIDIGVDPKPDKVILANAQGNEIYIVGAMRNAKRFLKRI